MSEQNDKLSDQEIGERLRLARDAAKLTQSDAANLIGAARTTIVAMEKGQRRVRIDELQKLAQAYGVSSNSILRRQAVYLDMIPRFRKLADSDSTARQNAVRILNDLVQAELELENALGIRRTRQYPPERPLLPGNVVAQAELDAQELRNWLGLGPGPIVDVISLLEFQLGVRVYIRPLEGKVSGLFAFDKDAGACVLLNGNHRIDRIRQTALHEVGHLIGTRHQPEIFTEDEVFQTREEKYANSFARAFLTPARSVQQQFAEITAGQSHFTRRHVILLAHAFGVSREAIVRRLEELSIVKPGTWDWFQTEGGISDDQVKEVLGYLPKSFEYMVESRSILPTRLTLLAREAWKLDFYSESQLSRLLRLDLHQMRQVLDGAELEEQEANEFIKLRH